MPNNILILYAHPASHKSRINKAMLNAIRDLENVTFRNLYECYPDFHIDIKAEQKLLVENDIIVFQHPFYWYSAPPLLKEWIDLVLEHGFAFGSEGDKLAGKKLLTATSTGASKEAYTEGGHHHFTIPQLLAPFKATANLCKMTYLPPFVIHGALLIDVVKITEAANLYKKIIVGLRDNKFSDEELSKKDCIIQLN